ncbi:MAG: hypothetical protein IK151_01420 [Erysipelotrichaceae bacterium]|nr:hypothetical protein [Erysipelotrichaceae bacterium]
MKDLKNNCALDDQSLENVSGGAEEYLEVTLSYTFRIALDRIMPTLRKYYQTADEAIAALRTDVAQFSPEIITLLNKINNDSAVEAYIRENWNKGQ